MRNDRDHKVQGASAASSRSAIRAEQTAALARFALVCGVFLCLGLTAPVHAGDETAARREKIAHLPPAESQQLLRNQERFASLSPEDQQHMRKLHADLSGDPAGEQLRHVLERYHEWLKTLSPGQRAALYDLPAEERVARIKQLKSEQEARRAENEKPLTPEDSKHLVDWLETVAWQHKEKLLESMPAARRKHFETLDEKTRRRVLTVYALQHWSEVHPGNLDEVKRLVETLSPGAQKRLIEAANQQARRKLLREWLQIAAKHHFEQLTSGRALPPISTEDLTRFFEHELPAEQRERLLSLPADEMQRELRRLYFQRQLNLGPAAPGAEGGAAPASPRGRPSSPAGTVRGEGDAAPGEKGRGERKR